MGEIKIKEVLTQMMKPSSWGLFKTIKSSVKMTNLVRMMKVQKTRWLDHTNRFVEGTMKKCIVDI